VLVVGKTNFDKNPRLETAVGFLMPAPGQSKPRKTMIKIKMKITIKSPAHPALVHNLNHNRNLTLPRL
jgi:hypothetical protein